MNAIELKREIVTGKFTNEELNDLVQAIQFARAQIRREVKNTIRVGSQVEFKGKHGFIEKGTLTKIAIKYGTVRVGNMNWKVPLNMLTVA